MDLCSLLTPKSTFDCLKNKMDLTVDEIYTLARYPYISLAEYVQYTTFQERTTIKEIEDLNIYYFINILFSLLGGDNDTQELLDISFKRGALRAAVMFAKTQSDPTEQFITLIEKSFQILLSYPLQKKENSFSNLINVKIEGEMPRLFFLSRQKIGNQWFNNLIENKLMLFKYICRCYKKEKCFPIMLYSTIYSLYKFTPTRYNIQNCNNEDAALHKIINTFYEHIEYIKNK